MSGVAAERRRREKSAARGASDYHGKAGSGRRVGTGSRAHAAELERNGGSDMRQPRKGNAPYPGFGQQPQEGPGDPGRREEPGYFVRAEATRPGYYQPAGKSQTGYR